MHNSYVVQLVKCTEYTTERNKWIKKAILSDE